MNDSSTNPGESPTDREFNLALSDLIQTALADGVDVWGGWRVVHESGGHDVGVEIYRLEGAGD